MTREYLRSDRHVYRCIAGEHLLIALHRDSTEPMFALTVTAAEVWTALENWTTVEALAERLSERFDISVETANTDVIEFLTQLEAIGALQHREAQ
jgi:hypothetical protein